MKYKNEIKNVITNVFEDFDSFPLWGHYRVWHIKQVMIWYLLYIQFSLYLLFPLYALNDRTWSENFYRKVIGYTKKILNVLRVAILNISLLWKTHFKTLTHYHSNLFQIRETRHILFEILFRIILVRYFILRIYSVIVDFLNSRRVIR